MAIKDILLPLVGEPSAAAIAAIDKCMAAAANIGAGLLRWQLKRTFQSGRR
jgi:hypothetical protein